MKCTKYKRMIDLAVFKDFTMTVESRFVNWIFVITAGVIALLMLAVVAIILLRRRVIV